MWALSLVKKNVGIVFIIIILILIGCLILIHIQKQNFKIDLLEEKNVNLEQSNMTLQTSLKAKEKEFIENGIAFNKREIEFAQSRTREASLRKDFKKLYDENKEVKSWADFCIPNGILNSMQPSGQNTIKN